VTVQALEQLAALPGVGDVIDAAREACTQLRWHPALRRRTDEARAETLVRAAQASAALSGARLPVSVVREAVLGAVPWPDDAAGRTVAGAVRALAEADRLAATWQRAPLQALARLHVAAARGLVPDDGLGRPRLAGEEPGDGADLLDAEGVAVPAPDAAVVASRLAGIVELVAAPPASPALVVAAVVHAELATARPFRTGNGVLARAACRMVVTGRGLDPTGVAVWESALGAIGPAYPLALAGYAGGGADGVAHWLRTFGQAVVDGAEQGRLVCDAVLAGRFLS